MSKSNMALLAWIALNAGLFMLLMAPAISASTAAHAFSVVDRLIENRIAPAGRLVIPSWLTGIVTKLAAWFCSTKPRVVPTRATGG